MVRSSSGAVAAAGLAGLLILGCAGGSDSRPANNTTFGSGLGSSDGGDDDAAMTDGGASTGMADDTGAESGSDSGGTTGGLSCPNLAHGTWELENVSNSAPMSLHPTRAIIDDGTELVAWAETDIDQISILNMQGAVLKDGGWVQSVLTSTDTQDTFPSIAGGPVAHLVWTGQAPGTDDRDLLFATGDAGGWSIPRNLTDAFDLMAPTNETQPAIGHRSNGELYVVYLSAPPVPKMGVPEPPGVFVVEFTVANDPSGQQQVVSGLQANCSDVAAATAGDDTGHAVAKCTDDGQSVLIHITDRSGDWTDDTLAGTTSGILSPELATGADGEVHLVWIQDTQCGADLCGDVYYSHTNDGVFQTPVNVTNSANLEERQPTVGVDACGRVLVLSQARVDNVTRMYLSVSEDGGQTFAPAERISPDDTADDFQVPRGLMFDDAGNPSFAFERLQDGSDPLNIDIAVARFVPS